LQNDALNLHDDRVPSELCKRAQCTVTNSLLLNVDRALMCWLIYTHKFLEKRW